LSESIEIIKAFTFDAAHYLPYHEGKCQHLHGHTYKLEIGVLGRVRPDTGMVLDFSDFKGIVDENIVQPMDHRLLNDIQNHDFPASNPTAENMVVWIRNRLREVLKDKSVTISFVRLWETPTSYALWRAY